MCSSSVCDSQFWYKACFECVSVVLTGLWEVCQLCLVRWWKDWAQDHECSSTSLLTERPVSRQVASHWVQSVELSTSKMSSSLIPPDPTRLSLSVCLDPTHLCSVKYFTERHWLDKWASWIRWISEYNALLLCCILTMSNKLMKCKPLAQCGRV